MRRRIAIAEDNQIMRAGVVRLLGEAGFEVAAKVTTGDALLEVVGEKKRNIDAVITDHEMPDGETSGLEAAIALRRENPELPVLVFSSHVVPELALQLISENPRGVGYLLKQHVTNLGQFADSLRRVMLGESVIDPTIVERLVNRNEASGHIRSLTDREREIMELVAEGYSNRAIGELAFMSPKTVEGHIRSAFAKLGIPTGQDARDVNRRVVAVLRFLAHE